MSLYGVDQEVKKPDTSSTFLDNLSLPVHRWYRYSAGFSALWVRDLIEREQAGGECRVFDPFAGSGTVLLEGEACGVAAMGVEAHPFVARVARSKLLWREDPKVFREFAAAVLATARKQGGDADGYPPLIEKCFPRHTLSRLDALRRAWESAADSSPASELTWVALASILRECSPVGTAQWQYVLPKKSKASATDAYRAFETKVYLMSGDMATRQRHASGPPAILHAGDARDCAVVPAQWATLVITSPPYTNNYDYADATRLEMSFFGDVEGWGDLQETVRKFLVCSCTQHVAPLNGQWLQILANPVLDSIRSDITAVCETLEAERDKHGGKKPYHTMIAAYFQDMAKVWLTLRRVASQDGLVCFVVGDSAPYGIYVPVERWLGELAIAAGFRSFTFEKTRNRNIKWKNRKHRVPLHEGRLWVKG